MNTLDSVADIAAIDALAELVEAVKARPVDSNAGFGCFYGGSGMGKTTAIQAVKSRYAQGEIMVAEGQEYWKSASPKAMLRGLLKGLDYVAPVSWTIDRLQDEVVCQVLAQDCVLIIDEADMACGGGRIQRLEVLRNIHDALGVGIGALREMVAEGQVTGDVVFEALTKRLPEIRADFESLPVTMQRGWDGLKAALDQRLVQLDKIFGLSNKIAGLFEFVQI